MVFHGLVGYWNRLVNAGDKRSNQLLFISDPTVVICAAIGYLVMVTAGPRFMEKRDPFQLRKVLIGYNFCSVLFSMWMMWEVIILMNFFACLSTFDFLNSCC